MESQCFIDLKVTFTFNAFPLSQEFYGRRPGGARSGYRYHNRWLVVYFIKFWFKYGYSITFALVDMFWLVSKWERRRHNVVFIIQIISIRENRILVNGCTMQIPGIAGIFWWRNPTRRCSARVLCLRCGLESNVEKNVVR